MPSPAALNATWGADASPRFSVSIALAVCQPLAAFAAVTVKVAALLFTDAAVLLATARYCRPLSLVVVAGVV